MDEQIKLSDEQMAKLKSVQRDLHDLLPLYDSAEECGIDCAMNRQLADQTMRRLQALEKNFGPNPAA